MAQPGSAAAQLTFAGLQRNGHAVLNVLGPGVRFAGLANGSTGIVAPYITTGNEWAAIGGDGRIAPLSSYASDINSGSASDHVKITTIGTTTLAATATRASLNMQNADSSAGQILDLGGHGLGLSAGGTLSSGPGSSTIQSGSLSTTAGEIVIKANNNLTISSSIVDGGAATTLTKAGVGVLTLSGANTYTGPTAVMEGTLIAASDANLRLGSTIDLSGSTLKAAGSFSSTKGFSGNVSTVHVVDTGGVQPCLLGPEHGQH
jgi:autotransporter-associated beta strand protein